jgi:hypothetical protein
MNDQPNSPGSWVRKWAAPLGLLAAAVALCWTGLFRVSDEDYDGVISMLDPIFLGACCGAVALLVTAVMVGWLARDD